MTVRWAGGGFAIVPSLIVRKYGSEIGAYGIALYTILATYADNETGESWPSKGTLAEVAGMSENTVRKYLAQLESLGIISISSRFRPDGGRTSDLITLNPPPFEQDPPSSADGGAPPSVVEPELDSKKELDSREQETNTAPPSSARPAISAEVIEEITSVEAMGSNVDELVKRAEYRLGQEQQLLDDLVQESPYVEYHRSWLREKRRRWFKAFGKTGRWQTPQQGLSFYRACLDYQGKVVADDDGIFVDTVNMAIDTCAEIPTKSLKAFRTILKGGGKRREKKPQQSAFYARLAQIRGA